VGYVDGCVCDGVCLLRSYGVKGCDSVEDSGRNVRTFFVYFFGSYACVCYQPQTFQGVEGHRGADVLAQSVDRMRKPVAGRKSSMGDIRSDFQSFPLLQPSSETVVSGE
jgi:hypothetical protein